MLNNVLSMLTGYLKQQGTVGAPAANPVVAVADSKKTIQPTNSQEKPVEQGKYTFVPPSSFGMNINPDPQGPAQFAKAYSKEDIKKMGLPDWAQPENVRLRDDGKMLDVYKDLGDKKWARVGFEIGKDNSLTPKERQFGQDRGMTEAVLKEGLPFIVSSMMPAIAGPMGSMYGLSGTAAGVAGGATLGAVNSAISGQNILKGAATGGISGAAGGLAKELATAGGLNPILARVVSGGLTGGAATAINGGDALKGLLMGSVSGGTGGMNPGAAMVLKLLLNNALSGKRG